MADLTLMREFPERYLFDRTCPQKALEDTGLFSSADSRLFGREKEIAELTATKKKIAEHVFEGEASPSSESEELLLTFDQMNNFLCELVLLSGYSGSGKSSLLNQLREACKEEGWFVLSPKYEKNLPPIKAVTKAFDDFFGTWASRKQGGAHSDMLESFDEACQSISSTIDREGLRELSELMPNLVRVFPEIATAKNGDNATSSTAKVGSAKKRYDYMIHVIVQSLCSSGRPVLWAQDDLQW